MSGTGDFKSDRTGEEQMRSFFGVDSSGNESIDLDEVYRGNESGEDETFIDVVAAETATTQPLISNAQIRDLGDPEYQLVEPLLITLEDYRDEESVVARYPEISVFGTGVNESEAIADLKAAILDLFDDLLDEGSLGEEPLAWRRVLNSVIIRATEA